MQKGIDTSAMMGAPTQAITVPTCRLAVMTLQDLWPLIPYLREASERDIVSILDFSVPDHSKGLHHSLYTLAPLLLSYGS